MLTIAGGIVASVVTVTVTLLQTKEEKKKRRAEKFEELVTAVYEFDHWLDRKESISAFGIEEKLEVSPFAKVEAIAGVYFPQFVKTVSELQLTIRTYEVWISEAAQKRIAGDTQHVSDGLLDVYNPYMKKREELLDGLRAFAVSHFQNDTPPLHKRIENRIREFLKK